MQVVLGINTMEEAGLDREKSGCTAGWSLSQPHKEFWTVLWPIRVIPLLVEMVKYLYFHINQSVDMDDQKDMSFGEEALGSFEGAESWELSADTWGKPSVGEGSTFVSTRDPDRCWLR